MESRIAGGQSIAAGSLKTRKALSLDGLRMSFSCNEGGNFDVHTMALDGARRLRLTNDRASQRYGAWSPDRKRIAFIAGKYPTSEIYLIDSNGSKAKRLTAC